MPLPRPTPLIGALLLVAHSFIANAAAAAQPTAYVMVDPTTLFQRDVVQITGINDQGHLIGNHYLTASTTLPVLWIQGRTYELTLLPNFSRGNAVDINNDGTIIGNSVGSSGGGTGMIWNAGQPTALQDLIGINAAPSALNDNGDIVGRVFGPDNRSWGFTYLDGELQQINTTLESTSLNDVNAAGISVGAFQQNSSSSGRALRREAGSSINIGFNQGTISSATAINDAGQITGWGYADTFTGRHAFRHRLVNGVGQIDDLTPPSATESAGQAIAEDGTVFGWATFPGESADVAMLLAGADSVRLADLTIGDDQVTLARVNRLNRRGWLAVEDVWTGDPRTPVSPNYLLIPRTEATSTFANLSVRANLDGSAPLIVGTATAGGAQEVLVRGVGPGLSPYLSAGTPLAGDPALQVFDASQTELATNDDWDAAATGDAIATAQAFPLPLGSTDAALATTIDGPTSAHLTNTGAEGIGLIELFSLATADPAKRLVNLSARYQVGTGENTFIAGFTITGDGPKTVLIRGVGPSLSDHGITDPVADPEIVLFNGTGEIVARNDDWSGNLVSVFDAVGAFALQTDSKDAAMVLPLWPGLYTVHLRSVDDGAGQGLIEIYDLDL